MKPRLVRAVQRGGMVVHLGADRWGIWRGRDRRGRMIGETNGADVDVLRLRGALKPLGDGQPTILVWGESVLHPPTVAPCASQLHDTHLNAHGPLIELMLARSQNRELRPLIRETARRYTADIEASAQAGAAHGMNWNGLALGGRIDGGRGPRVPDISRHAARSGAAIETIQRHLRGDEIELLDRLILSRDTRAQLVKRFGGRPTLMESRALAAIRALHLVYETKIRSVN
nr:hypothetical protein [Hyphomonas sp. Mor2]